MLIKFAPITTSNMDIVFNGSAIMVEELLWLYGCYIAFNGTVIMVEELLWFCCCYMHLDC